MTRNQMNIPSPRHHRRNLKLAGRRRSVAPPADTLVFEEPTKKTGPWTGREVLVPITFDAASEHAFEVAIEMAK